jgi:hypothetical protein
VSPAPLQQQAQRKAQAHTKRRLSSWTLGNATVDVEIQPPESSAWVKAEIGLDASADVVKVYEAPACKIRLNCTAYTSDTPFWIVESSNKS